MTEMSLENGVKYLIRAIHWTSPYKWIDYPLERLQNKKLESKREKIKNIRYAISSAYIFAWLCLSIVFLFNHDSISLIFVYFLMLRVVGILNKEIGVVLFGVNKITTGFMVSSPPRVIILAFVNYLTVGFLFALLYTKIGVYDGYSSGLPLKQAVLQSMSILFTFSPTYDSEHFTTKLIMLTESGFCFVFAILIISTFVGLIRLNSEK